MSSETAGGRPGRAWSAPPSSSCLLGPCSRSLPRQAMERRRPLLHVSLTITLRQTVGALASFGVYLNTLLTCRNVPGFSLSGQRSYAYVIRAEEGEPGNEASRATDLLTKPYK